MSEKLKPCPFCGNKNVRLRGDVTCGFETMNVFCDNCHATGPWCDSERGAIKCWNYREEPITLMSPITTVSEGEPQTYVPLRTCENVSEVAYGFKCSICGDWEDIDHPKYCAHCGAKVVKK